MGTYAKKENAAMTNKLTEQQAARARENGKLGGKTYEEMKVEAAK